MTHFNSFFHKLLSAFLSFTVFVAPLVPIFQTTPAYAYDGCMDAGYLEYDPGADNDPGGYCITPKVPGCTDPTAFNYNPSANFDNGSCVAVIPGCMNSAYVEFNASANTDNGSCATPKVYGCTNSLYVEYNASANTDDGSCINLIPTPPTLSTARVNAYTLTLTYNEALDINSTPLTSDFVVSVQGSPVTVSYVNILGSNVVLTLAESVGQGTGVIIFYTPGTTPIQDIAGFDAESLSDSAINSTADLVLPTVTLNQKVGQNDPTTVSAPVLFTAVFSEAIDTNTFTTADISTSGSTATGITINSVTEVAPNDGTTFEISISATGSGTIVASIPGISRKLADTLGEDSNDITIDSAGNIYTANAVSNNVSKITPQGVSTILGTTGIGPNGITIDSAGNIYTANTGSNDVSKITPQGVSTILGTTGNSPRDITIDSAGNIYTANYGSNNVSKITPQGVSTILGTTGLYPYSITIDSAGNIYTPNEGNNTVTKITPQGVSTILGTTGISPRGIAIDSSDNLYVTSRFSGTVTKITPQGVSTILGTTADNPYGIVLDSAGNIYTANNGPANVVTKITPQGVSTILGKTNSNPYGITIDSAGNLYTNDSIAAMVTKFLATPALTGITDIAGNGNENSTSTDNSVTFVGDSTPPTLSSHTPTGIAVMNLDEVTELTMTFDENIAKGTGNIALYNSADDTLVATIDVTDSVGTDGFVTISGSIATITLPTSISLSPVGGYYIHVDNSAFEDSAGNAFAGIVDDATFTFQGVMDADATPPSAPSSFTATVSSSTVNLSWINPVDSDFDSVTIRRSTSTYPVSITDGTAVATDISATTRTDTSLSNATYYYSIFAKDSTGNISTAAQSTATVNVVASGGGGGGGGSFYIYSPIIVPVAIPPIPETFPIKNVATPTMTTNGATLRSFSYLSENPSILTKLQSQHTEVKLTETLYKYTCETKQSKPYYRKCELGINLDTFSLFRNSVLCEGFIEQKADEKDYRIQDTAPRKEAIGIAVKMKKVDGKQVSLVEEKDYTNIYQDIGKNGGEASWIQPVVETALKYSIVSKDRTSFEPDRNITRAESYAMVMKSVCMTGESEQSGNWQQSIFNRASTEGLTSRTWNTFEPERPILRQELFTLASLASDWAERTGGCDPKPKYCFLKE